MSSEIVTGMLRGGTASRTVLSFSWAGWLAIAFLVLVLFLARNVRRRAWRGEHTFLRKHHPPPGWPWGGPVWRGYVRALAIAPGLSWMLLIVAALGRLTPRHSVGASAWLVLAIGWLALTLGVGASIVLFARPQLLVPPAVRGQPGAVAEWRAGLRPRRRTRA